jgi:hypothetical protein
MNPPVELCVRGLEHSAALEAAVRGEAARLARVCGELPFCRVTIEALPGEPGLDVRVEVGLAALGGAPAARPADVYAALQAAFDDARHRLIASHVVWPAPRARP